MAAPSRGFVIASPGLSTVADSARGFVVASPASTEMRTQASAEQPPITWSIEEVARRWHLSTRTIRRMVARGDLVGFKPGTRKLRVYVDSVIRREQSMAA